MDILSDVCCITLKSGTRLNYIPESVVNENIRGKGFEKSEDVLGITRSDLNAGIYEGGLKIWDGAIDMCNYIDEHCTVNGLSVLELGCGAALPSILALKKGAKHAVVTDFNQFVLECFTQQNFASNEVLAKSWSSVAASWSKLNKMAEEGKLQAKSFDLILTSETIYNVENYEDLHEAMDLYLTENGMILVAAKVYYFGLGSSIHDFEEFLRQKKVFTSKEVWSTTDEGIPRKILELRRVTSC